MNEAGYILDELMKRAREDEEVRQALLATRKDKEPLIALCNAAQEMGYSLYPMDLLDAADEWVGQMIKSVNGGGANHSEVNIQNDFYEQFFIAIS